ncbi:hypothetical protein MLD38_037065 [Melastoma candidum]|uniref:Uncharacterized protein n=1 Tax=Melastoma candidum TaxID=119954 RepID=A0ACB9LNI2_9MYRT|nr:hypothetical protein MLD38_037065 [Melastoma candidum]
MPGSTASPTSSSRGVRICPGSKPFWILPRKSRCTTMTLLLPAQWLADLRDVAYDMEDLLDHFSVAAKRAESKAQSSKLPHCLVACCSPFRPCTLISRHRLQIL